MFWLKITTAENVKKGFDLVWGALRVKDGTEHVDRLLSPTCVSLNTFSEVISFPLEQEERVG